MKLMAILTLALWFLSDESNGNIDSTYGKELWETKCVSCHGEPGSDLKSPIISGMPEEYLYSQLKAFYTGERYDRLMYEMNYWAEDLSDDDMRAIANYVSRLDPCQVSFPSQYTDGNRDRGEELFFSKGCVECHQGEDAKRARLDRQKGDYLLYALAAFKTGIRRKPVMEDMVRTLTTQDQLNLAQYFNSNDFCLSEN